MHHKKNTVVIILVALLLVAVTSMDIWMVFSQTRKQTKETGAYQLEMIGGELEGTISGAENLTMELALAAREYIDDEEALETFIYKKKKELIAGETGAFNVFIAGKDYVIIPDFDIPDDFVASDRIWYTGALKNKGKTYVSPPYQDAMTGEICYSVSVLLGDGSTILGVDYTMENIQAHIAQMYETGSHNAVIITDEGIVAGCSDEKMIGKKLVDVLPDYAGIWSLSKNSKGVQTARIKADFLYENLFATKSGNGWYLIINESDWELYKNSYTQLFVIVSLFIILFTVVIILYVIAVKNQKRAESALASKEEFLSGITGELKGPLAKILEISRKEKIEDADDYIMEMARIRQAGERLSEMIGQIILYSDIVQTERRSHAETKKTKREMNKRFRTLIMLFMIFVMLISLYMNISVTYSWGNVRMQRQAENYEFELSEWIDTQKGILDMFVSTISTNPEMLDDYQGTVDYLNRITMQYPEISVSYMTNPKLKHTVYMNNGWEPDADWHVEERQWYVDLMASEENWLISTPYYDEQTGGYCVTFAEKVFDHKTGAFLGNFGIDFFMDKLVDILGDSYSEKGYAFLVDTEGDIINHPYGSYQMSQEGKTNVSALSYGAAKVDGKSTQLIRDYDGTVKVLTAVRNDASKFAVYAVAGIWTIYGKAFIYGMLCVIIFLACIILLYRLLTGLIHKQDENNRQMKDAADTAIAAGRAKSRFLAQMSHEIRTPINAVLGMNEMILRESGDRDILEYAENIRSAGRNLLSIINSILDFSKIEDGKMEIIPVKYDVASVVNNLVNSIADRARSKSLDFAVEIDEKLPCVLFGDDVRITQVIMNLLTNAVKYTEEGKVTLSIREKEREADRIILEVTVSDTGIGIREEDMGKLFESFERLEERRNRNIEGTGLGMSIVTKLLRMMGSELHVDSVYGKGSKFSFCLQQTVIDAQPVGDYASRLAKSKENKETEIYLYAPEAKVLVVDDNEMNRKVVKNLMKQNGVVPDLAASGEEAIEKIRESFYHIVFLDHMMPKMDGMETLHRLKEENLVADGMAVVALTANAVMGAKEKYIKAGFDDYLSKPIEVDRLEQKLSKHLPEKLVQWVEKGKEQVSARDTEEALEFTPTEEILEFSPEEESIEFALDEDVMEFSPDDSTGEGQGDDLWLEKLRQSSLDVDSALRFCGGEEDFYKELLEDFVKAHEDKLQELSGYREAEDWKEYRTLVHSMKSSSKTIGAGALSDRAKELEDAARAEDRTFIEEHHEEFVRVYRDMVKEITDAFDKNSGIDV